MTKATLYLRVVLPDGRHHYAKAVYNANGHLKADYALIGGRPERHPEGVYHLRYPLGGKRIWEGVGTDASVAAVALQNKNFDLRAIELGRVPPQQKSPSPTAEAATKKATTDSQTPLESKRSLKSAIAEYLKETAEHKSVATYAAYKVTLERFGKVCTKKHLEDLDRADLLAFVASMRDKRSGFGSAPRTIRNRVDFLQIFLHHFGLPSLLKGKDLPTFTEKAVRAYPRSVLSAMFAAADQEESDLLQFFLCTGGREKEVQFACWSDIDAEARTFTITEKLDLGYTPKDSEEGAIQVPAALISILEARRKRFPTSRLIFPLLRKQKVVPMPRYLNKKRATVAPSVEKERSNGHLLTTIKSLGLRAGVNCGHCVNKAGKSCKTHPVCKHVILHKLRKTFATMHHNNGMPVRTLMRMLRHSDLETTQRYIADQEDSETRVIVEGTFTAFAHEPEMVA